MPANPYKVGDEILVPIERLRRPQDREHAVVTRTVNAVDGAFVEVDDFPDPVTRGPDGRPKPQPAPPPRRLNSSIVQPANLGVLILRVGDFSSELTLLDPLAKSVLQYLRLLLPDDRVKAVSLRTWAELQAVWKAESDITTHVVLVSHGSTDGVSFVDAKPKGGRELAAGLLALSPDTNSKIFLSLACQSGRATFLKELSSSALASHCLGPHQNVHGAVASQFCQTFLSALLLEGRTVSFAHKRAAAGAPAGISWRRWTDGKLTAIQR